LLTVAMGLELVANHFQMTYYLMLLVGVIGIVYLVDAFKKKTLSEYFKAVGVMLAAVILAIGLNATNILATKEYADESTRGNSGLTINADGLPKEKKSGLDYEYITEYSYGILESFNLYIPRFMGGSSTEALPNDSEPVKALIRMGYPPHEAVPAAEGIPMYWGDQTFVGAPAYIGAVIIFLSVLGLFLVKGRKKWWILIGVLLALMLSWGRNFSGLTKFFIDYVPLYDKFRAVSSIQVIIELILPVLAIAGLHQFFIRNESVEEKKKALIYSIGIVGGISVIFLLFGDGMFDFASPVDQMIREQLGLPFVEAVRDDRKSLFTSDTLRSLIFVVLTAAVLWYALLGKLKQNLAVAALGILILADLVAVDRRYVTEEAFVQKRVME